MLPDDEHNRRLVGHVHPPQWINPTPAGRYNLVVIGAGTAGLVTAAGAAGLGAKVALVERRYMGGDCLNAGCVPSKGLISAARISAAARRAEEFGVRVSGEIAVDFPAVMERVRRLRADIAPNDSAARFRDLGVDVFFGEGTFLGPDSIAVAGQTLRFARAVIATGTRPARPEIPGLNETGFLTNETVFEAAELPQRLAVLGGGPIGCELAQAFARFGSQVTVIEQAPRILGKEDRDAVERVHRALLRDGVTVLTNAQVARVHTNGSEKTLETTVNGEPQSVIVDDILVAIGRTPNVDGLNLGAAGVAYDPRLGVTVNDRLQTTNSRVFAAGDVCSSEKFTHAADFFARIAIQNALFFGQAKASSLIIPRCTYTSPELAHVGLTEDEAHRRGVSIRAFVQELTHVDRAILAGDDDGFVKVLVRKGTDEIVGGTIVAEQAGDMIGELTLAIRSRIGLKSLAATIHPYPTIAEAIRKTGDQFHRTRLTPFMKSLFQKWFAWTR
jgi:pyruvate/2-oxoglutarate dehydrogenase complex dihydrolipoamide dehydrogenase (E3) component